VTHSHAHAAIRVRSEPASHPATYAPGRQHVACRAFRASCVAAGARFMPPTGSAGAGLRVRAFPRKRPLVLVPWTVHGAGTGDLAELNAHGALIQHGSARLGRGASASARDPCFCLLQGLGPGRVSYSLLNQDAVAVEGVVVGTDPELHAARRPDACRPGAGMALPLMPLPVVICLAGRQPERWTCHLAARRHA
jgi:hypothetical protein